MKHIASCSFGKDSLAMVLRLIEENEPLDEVVFYDTGMEFNAIYHVRNKLVPVLRKQGIKYTELYPDNPFEYDLLDRPVTSKEKGFHLGYGWCGGVCRWGTTAKNKAIEQYLKTMDEEIIEYVGIAKDELNRIKTKNYPLVRWGMTESDCLEYCRLNGWNWLEESSVEETGYIDLYNILDRVSCWCCANKNRKELKNIWLFLPQYWEKLEYIQSRLERPMKKFVRKGVPYGNVFDMAKTFEKEEEDK